MRFWKNLKKPEYFDLEIEENIFDSRVPTLASHEDWDWNTEKNLGFSSSVLRFFSDPVLQLINPIKRAKAFRNFGTRKKKNLFNFLFSRFFNPLTHKFASFLVSRLARSIKFTPTNFAFILMIVCALASCMDRVPDVWDNTKQLAKSQYYGYRADKKDEIEASYTSAQATCCGPDKINDDLRALELYCKAAGYGHNASMVEVARMYSHKNVSGPGTAIPYDASLAYAYYVKAAENDYPAFVAMRDGFKAEISSDEVSKGEDLVKRFPDIPCTITK